jgi:DNA/RNA endonuclease G (NUC1)
MKKYILLIFSLVSLNIQAQRDSVLVNAGIFKTMYSEVKQQPLWSEYTVLCVDGKASRVGMDFYTVPGYITSDNNDYVNNVYDKGHMAPAASFNCNKEVLLKTFSYLNCCLQNEKLNRGVWRILELHERDLAIVGNVKVKIVCTFTQQNILPTGAWVPTGFYKFIYFNGELMEKYYFPNQSPTKKTYSEYIF